MYWKQNQWTENVCVCVCVYNLSQWVKDWERVYCEKWEVSMSLHVKVDPPENESKKRQEEEEERRQQQR